MTYVFTVTFLVCILSINVRSEMTSNDNKHKHNLHISLEIIWLPEPK